MSAALYISILTIHNTELKEKDDMSMFIDKASVYPCKVHGVKPRFYMINKKKEIVSAECPNDMECFCVGNSDNIVNEWNSKNEAE